MNRAETQNRTKKPDSLTSSRPCKHSIMSSCSPHVPCSNRNCNLRRFIFTYSLLSLAASNTGYQLASSSGNIGHVIPDCDWPSWRIPEIAQWKFTGSCQYFVSSYIFYTYSHPLTSLSVTCALYQHLRRWIGSTSCFGVVSRLEWEAFHQLVGK